MFAKYKSPLSHQNARYCMASFRAAICDIPWDPQNKGVKVSTGNQSVRILLQPRLMRSKEQAQVYRYGYPASTHGFNPDNPNSIHFAETPFLLEPNQELLVVPAHAPDTRLGNRFTKAAPAAALPTHEQYFFSTDDGAFSIIIEMSDDPSVAGPTPIGTIY